MNEIRGSFKKRIMQNEGGNKKGQRVLIGVYNFIICIRPSWPQEVQPSLSFSMFLFVVESETLCTSAQRYAKTRIPQAVHRRDV